MYNKNLAHYIVVTAIIIKDGRYLIVKRSDKEKAFPGKWTVPGGKLEALDYLLREKDTNHHWYNILENCIKREVKEEVDLEINNINYITSMVYIREDNIPCLIISLYANNLSGEIKLCNDLVEHKWIDIEEAKNYDLIEGIFEELKIVDDHLKNGKQKLWVKHE